ncbi:MAG: helix-turn-helix transcriptional regulator [Bacillota bacterium]
MMNEKTDDIKIGNRIRLVREDLGMTRDNLSELIDITPYFLGQIERGERNMSVKTLIKIATCLNVSIDYLVYGTDKKSEQK